MKFTDLITKEYVTISQSDKRIKLDLEEKGAIDFVVKSGIATFKDDLILKATIYYDHISYQILSACFDCGEQCYSEPCRDLYQLGKMYVDFEPDYTHKCEIDD